MRNALLIGLVALGAFAGPRSAEAQDSVLAELYGHGVHAYFSGNYAIAHEYLTTAVEQGTRDPRAFYFRGLSYARLGRPDEAKMDFTKGAELETSGADRVYPVARSLQRVQGRMRLDVEKHRQLARLAALRRELKAKAARYEQLQNAEGEVLRDPNRPAPPKAADLVGPPAANASDPFASDAADATPEVATTPPPAEVTEDAAGADAFGDPMDTTPMPATDDPFGEAGSDPFGDAGSDPFGEPAADDATTDPFGDDPPAMDDDPFGS